MSTKHAELVGLHIGQMVNQRIGEMGITKAEFGRRINTTRQNVNTLINKPDWDADFLLRASRVLQFNFFAWIINQHLSAEDYQAITPGSSGEVYGETTLLREIFQTIQKTIAPHED